MQVFTASPAAVYTGMGNAITRISSTEGFRALWRGVTSVIVGAGPAHAVHFGVYEAVKELFGGNVAGKDAGDVFMATGSCSLSRSVLQLKPSQLLRVLPPPLPAMLS
jgi:solute carrier family 25 iron transporter 28/37